MRKICANMRKYANIYPPEHACPREGLVQKGGPVEMHLIPLHLCPQPLEETPPAWHKPSIFVMVPPLVLEPPKKRCDPSTPWLYDAPDAYHFLIRAELM